MFRNSCMIFLGWGVQSLAHHGEGLARRETIGRVLQAESFAVWGCVAWPCEIPCACPVLGSCGPRTEYKTLRVLKRHLKIHFRAENTDKNKHKKSKSSDSVCVFFIVLFISYFCWYLGF